MQVRNLARRLFEFIHLLPRAEFSARLIPDHPDAAGLRAHEVVVVGNRTFQKWALLQCPCGCGETIMLSLSKKKRPSWSVHVDWLGRPTLDPSIRQTSKCYSHFWVKKGRVIWCADTGRAWSYPTGTAP